MKMKPVFLNFCISEIVFTCIPQRRTPNCAEVEAAHLAICRDLFSAEASSPCCLVPILRSSMHGRLNLDATFYKRMKTTRNKKIFGIFYAIYILLPFKIIQQN